MKIILSLLLLLFLNSGVLANHPEYPRGIRNNNPGNLVKTNIPWQGKVECKTDNRFECFSSPYYGIRAMTKTVKAYMGRHKIKTFEEFFTRWAPPHENSTSVVIEYFKKLFPHQDLWTVDLHHFISELIYFENGSNPYTREQIEGVFNNVFPNTRRNYNRPRGYPSGGYAKNMGDVPASKDGTEQGHVQSVAVKTEEPSKGPRGKGQGCTVDKAYNSLDVRILHHLIAKTGSTVHGYNSLSRMDRDRQRVPILHGRQGGTEVEGIKRFSNYTLGYSYGIVDNWDVLRGFPGGA